MANTVLMVCAAIVFVSFWAYLAWDSHKEVIKAESEPRKRGKGHKRLR